VRDGNEWEFVFPYTSVLPYKSCDIANQPTAGTSVVDCYGGVSVYVLNALTAPSTAPSNINLLMEWAAHDDFEFAIPVS